MNRLPTCFACCLLLCGVTALAQNPRDALDEARSLAREGKYEEALQRHVWFHENALKKEPALVGVRLSFALTDWIRLGEKYPKARDTLVKIRDRDTKELVSGKGSFDLFHDVSAINKYLEEVPKTVALFKTIAKKEPELAVKCYRVAEPHLVASREYKLCIEYTPDTLKRFEAIRKTREDHIKLAETKGDQFKDIGDRFFLLETCRLIEIMAGAGKKQDAEKIREKALAIRGDDMMKEAIDTALKNASREKD